MAQTPPGPSEFELFVAERLSWRDPAGLPRWDPRHQQGDQRRENHDRDDDRPGDHTLDIGRESLIRIIYELARELDSEHRTGQDTYAADQRQSRTAFRNSISSCFAFSSTASSMVSGLSLVSITSKPLGGRGSSSRSGL